MTRPLFILSALLCIVSQTFAQQTIRDSILFDGVHRSYILYVPGSVQPSTSVPLLINLHGRSRTADNQMELGDFRPIADTAGFIIVHPQGLKDEQGRLSWNLLNSNDTMDDIGLMDSLIDHLSNQYNIDPDRIYATGFSRGAFMAFTLSCQIGDRLAAIGGVGGAFVDSTGCGAFYPKPVIQIHGTADNQADYNTYNIAYAMSVAARYNQCDTTPIVTEVPDINTNDGCTATKIEYRNGYKGMNVIHYRINGGGHSWPGSASSSGTTNRDINASLEIWNYFSNFTRNGVITSVDEIQKVGLKIFPQPASDYIRVESENNNVLPYKIYNQFGFEMLSGTLQGNQNIDISSLSTGVYYLEVLGLPYKFVKF